jgi:hypothetical protein
MLPYLPYKLSRFRRRLVSGVALVAYLLATVGFPLPMPANQDTRTPFPCQGHACGCLSAEQCWQNCCCFSPAERLAWADQHQVTIPAELRADLERAATDEFQGSSCCRAKNDMHRGSSCCDKHEQGSDAGQADHDHSDAGHTIGWVSGWQAQKCQGLTMLWTSVGGALPLEIQTLWQFDWAEIGPICLISPTLSPGALQPTVPPPRG